MKLNIFYITQLVAFHEVICKSQGEKENYASEKFPKNRLNLLHINAEKKST